MRERYVVPMTRSLIMGWPESFNLEGTPDVDILVTRIRFNVPDVEGFLKIHQFRSTCTRAVEFSPDHTPHVCVARLPGTPFDVWHWTRYDRTCRITPMRVGPSHVQKGSKDLKIRLEYTGLVPPTFQNGKKFKLVMLLMGGREIVVDM